MNRTLKKFRNFRCVRLSLYSSCDKCKLIHSQCYYYRVFDHEPKKNFNPCPICLYFNTDICYTCLATCTKENE